MSTLVIVISSSYLFSPFSHLSCLYLAYSSHISISGTSFTYLCHISIYIALYPSCLILKNYDTHSTQYVYPFVIHLIIILMQCPVASQYQIYSLYLPICASGYYTCYTYCTPGDRGESFSFFFIIVSVL